MSKVKPIKNKKELNKILKQGPDYHPNNTYASIADTITDYFHLKFETKDMQKELKQGHNPIDKNSLVGDKHPHMSDNFKISKANLHDWKPLVQRLSTTEAGKQGVDAMHNIEKMSNARNILNKHPEYSNRLHLYSGKQVLKHMNHMIKSDKGFGLYDEADTERITSKDVNPRGVYGDLVRDGDMDGMFTEKPSDLRRHIKEFANNNPKIKQAFHKYTKNMKNPRITHHVLNHKPTLHINKKSREHNQEHNYNKERAMKRNQGIQR